MKQNRRIVAWNSKAPIFLAVFIGQLIGSVAAYLLQIPLFLGSIVLGIAGGLTGFAITKRKTL